MKTSLYQVSNREISMISGAKYAGRHNVDRFKFVFDEEWEGLDKTLKIKQGEHIYYVSLLNDTGLIPDEAYDGKEINIGIIGTRLVEGNLEVVLSTLPYRIPIDDGVYEEGEEPSNLPTPTQWDAYIDEINRLIEGFDDDVTEQIRLFDQHVDEKFDELTGDFYTKNQTNSLLDQKQDTLTEGTNIDIDENNTISTPAQVNVIETVKVNGEALEVDNTKAVNVPVPTNNNQLENGAGYITKNVDNLVNYTDTTTMNNALANKLDTSLKGANNGLAELDGAGKVPSSQLPSYVDDVLEYASKSAFPQIGESGKIYVAKDTDKTYRWGGSAYTEISESLALGETGGTAYRGDRGKIAYDHATDPNKIGAAQSKGFYKFGVTGQGHVQETEAVTKGDLTALGVEDSANKVAEVSDSSTHDQYPDAVCVNGIQNRVKFLEDLSLEEDLTWGQVRTIVDEGKAATYFPIGSQLTEDWKTKVNSTETTYNDVAMNVAHIYNSVTVQEDNEDVQVRGMALEWDKEIPYAVPFCAPQCIQCFDGTEGSTDGLPAGNYAFKVPSGGVPNWADARTAYQGKYLCFTLADAIPSGGCLIGDGWGNNNTWKLKVKASHLYSAATSASIAITVESALPAGYTFLGDLWGEDVGYGKLNWSECVPYGDNTWRDSDLRQWLNSSAAAGSWWERKTRYHMQPEKATTTAGFLYGYSEDFISKLRTKKVAQKTNYRKETGDVVYTYDKIFIASRTEMNTNVENEIDEDVIWDYYKALAVGQENLDDSGRFKNGSTYAILKRYKLESPTASDVYFNRSANRGYGSNVCNCTSSGSLGTNTANYSYRCLPACII